MATDRLLATNVYDVRGAYQRVIMLRSLKYDRVKSILDLRMADDGWTVEFSRFYAGDELTPRCYAARATTGDVFIFVDGIDTDRQGQGVWNWYTGNSAFQFSPLFQYTPDGAASNVYNAVLAGVNVPTNFWACGYSWGGVVASRMIPSLIRLSPGFGPTNLVAIGSPKPTNEPSSGPSQWNTVSMWGNNDDAVPLIPPDITTFQRVLGGLSAGQGQRLASFGVWPGRNLIRLDGSVIPFSGPEATGVPAVQQVGTWLQQQGSNTLTPHSLDTYRARLELAVSRLPPRSSIVFGSNGRGHNPIPQVQEVLRLQGEVVQTIFTDGSRQNALPVIVPDKEAFKAVKRGKTWCVQFGDTLIAYAPHRRRARGLARVGNEFLRRLQNEAVVQADDLAARWVQYLGDAVDSGNGFQPAMNVQIG